MSKRNISNRSLRQRFFGFLSHSYNDNFEISQLVATIQREEKNLEKRKSAVAKYQRYAVLYSRWPNIKDQALEMAKIEAEAVPHIEKHISYLKVELAEEYKKLESDSS